MMGAVWPGYWRLARVLALGQGIGVWPGYWLAPALLLGGALGILRHVGIVRLRVDPSVADDVVHPTYATEGRKYTTKIMHKI